MSNLIIIDCTILINLSSGAVIINGKTRRKSHSSWKVLRGTQALMTSCVRNLPIRVIRSSRLKSAYAPPNGFSFDGLFKVAMYWEEPTKNGHSVWRFKLLGAPPATHPRLPPLGIYFTFCLPVFCYLSSFRHEQRAHARLCTRKANGRKQRAR